MENSNGETSDVMNTLRRIEREVLTLSIQVDDMHKSISRMNTIIWKLDKDNYDPYSSFPIIEECMQDDLDETRAALSAATPEWQKIYERNNKLREEWEKAHSPTVNNKEPDQQ